MIAAYLDAAEKWDIIYPSLAITTLGKFGVNMTAPAGSDSKKLALLAVRRGVDTASAMGIPMIMIPSFFDDEMKTDSDLRETAECLKYACDYAAAKNIVISTENLLSAEATLELIDLVGKDALKVYFDTQNYKLFMKYNTQEIFTRLLPYICQIHVKDGLDCLSGALLGDGTADYDDMVRLIRASDYSGWIVSENYYDQSPLNKQSEDAFALLKEDANRLRTSFCDGK
jgi:sugar phosphate isomerase/epimerase